MSLLSIVRERDIWPLFNKAHNADATANERQTSISLPTRSSFGRVVGTRKLRVEVPVAPSPLHVRSRVL